MHTALTCPKQQTGSGRTSTKLNETGCPTCGRVGQKWGFSTKRVERCLVLCLSITQDYEGCDAPSITRTVSRAINNSSSVGIAYASSSESWLLMIPSFPAVS